MNLGIRAPEISVDPASLALTPSLLVNFAKAEAILRRLYGDSPSAIELAELWVAKATLPQVYREFVEMFDPPCDLLPNDEGTYDESCLGSGLDTAHSVRAQGPIVEKLRRRYGH